MKKGLYVTFCVLIAIPIAYLAMGVIYLLLEGLLSNLVYKVLWPAGLPLFSDPRDLEFFCQNIALFFGLAIGGISSYYLLPRKAKQSPSLPANMPAVAYSQDDNHNRTELEHVIDDLFETEKGLVVRLKNSRVLAPTGAEYSLFSSFEQYRRLSDDRGHWREILDPGEKRKLLAQAPNLLDGIAKLQ